MTEDDSHVVYRRSLSEVAHRHHQRDICRNFPQATRKKISRNIDVRGVHRVSQHPVWRCDSWLPPQRQRTRREKADHFRHPPTSRSSHHEDPRRSPWGCRGGTCRSESCPRLTTTWNPPKPMEPIGSISLGEGGNA